MRSIGRTQDEFLACDARDVAVTGPFAAVYLLDVMHHVPKADQQALCSALSICWSREACWSSRILRQILFGV